MGPQGSDSDYPLHGFLEETEYDRARGLSGRWIASAILDAYSPRKRKARGFYHDPEPSPPSCARKCLSDLGRSARTLVEEGTIIRARESCRAHGIPFSSR